MPTEPVMSCIQQFVEQASEWDQEGNAHARHGTGKWH
jgi:hypothetical protein